jgi:hypothetical protein
LTGHLGITHVNFGVRLLFFHPLDLFSNKILDFVPDQLEYLPHVLAVGL